MIRKHYYNKIEIRKYMNNKYCDVCRFLVNPYLFKDISLFIQKMVISLEKNAEMCIIEKSKEIDSEKTVGKFSLKP